MRRRKGRKSGASSLLSSRLSLCLRCNITENRRQKRIKRPPLRPPAVTFPARRPKRPRPADRPPPSGRLVSACRPQPPGTSRQNGFPRPLVVTARPLVVTARPLAATARPLPATARPLPATARPLVKTSRTDTRPPHAAAETERHGFSPHRPQSLNRARHAPARTGRNQRRRKADGGQPRCRET